MRSAGVPPGWLDRNALFQHIRAAGLKIDDSTLDEFQKQGLMLPPLRASRGRYGNPGYWSPQQAELLRSLCLSSQRKGAKSVATRCILPVWVWVYWGDEHGITLEQVQHIMHTWTQRMQRGLSRDQAHQLATDIVAQVGNAPEGGIQRAKRELTDLLSRPDVDPEQLLESLAHIFDPGKRPNGPHNLPIIPEAIAFQIQSLYHGIQILAQGQLLAPGLWLWARHMLLQQLASYGQQQPSYFQEVQGTSVASLYSEETVITRLLFTCSDLAMTLGAALLFPTKAHLPEQHRHEVWEQRVIAAYVTATPMLSPLWVPGSTLIRSLAIEENVTLA